MVNASRHVLIAGRRHQPSGIRRFVQTPAAIEVGVRRSARPVASCIADADALLTATARIQYQCPASDAFNAPSTTPAVPRAGVYTHRYRARQAPMKRRHDSGLLGPRPADRSYLDTDTHCAPQWGTREHQQGINVSAAIAAVKCSGAARCRHPGCGRTSLLDAHMETVSEQFEI